MSLPPPSNDVYWKSYEIDTPTFDLTPVEKPDMSPFLIHMTGKAAIESILKGEGAESELPTNHGFLRANIPDYSIGTYNAPVVCFSESPTFALDFFRYRKFERWKCDQRFGIGFRKKTLVEHGVRPVIYVDEQIINQFYYLYQIVIKSKISISNFAEIDQMVTNLLIKLYPIMFPLLEIKKNKDLCGSANGAFQNPPGLHFLMIQ